MTDVGVGAPQRFRARQRREDEFDPRAIDDRPMVAEADVGRRETEALRRSLRPTAPARLPAASGAG